MKNLKKVSRENLRAINGGYRMCPEDGIVAMDFAVRQGAVEV
jgi:hypothetical protein